MPFIYAVLDSNGIFKDKLLAIFLYEIDYFIFIVIIVFDIREQNSFRSEI